MLLGPSIMHGHVLCVSLSIMQHVEHIILQGNQPRLDIDLSMTSVCGLHVKMRIKPKPDIHLFRLFACVEKKEGLQRAVHTIRCLGLQKCSDNHFITSSTRLGMIYQQLQQLFSCPPPARHKGSCKSLHIPLHSLFVH